MNTENPRPLKRVLIITYYWPPSGGAGVQRWLKFAKYLPELGWIPVVYTPLNPESPSVDHSLAADIHPACIVVKRKICEPYDFYRRLVGSKKGEKIQAGFLSEEKKKNRRIDRIARWVRGNFFIPDARMFWINPSVKFLLNYLKHQPVDLIISTGPPHSMHLIADQVKKKTGIRWVADFRDPWTNIDFYEELMLTSFADKKHHRLENMVLQNSDAIVVIGKTMKDEFSHFSTANKVFVIPNGYDHDDLSTGHIEADPYFSIAHIGSLGPSRNPTILWQALEELTRHEEFREQLRIKLVGKADYTVRESIKNHHLTEALIEIPYLDHSAVINEQKKSSVLLLVVNNTKNAKGIVTGKIFEYIAAGRPIVAIGPVDGDLSHILRETKAGHMFDYSDKTGLKKHLTALFEQHPMADQRTNKENYDRKNLTAKLVNEVLTPLIEQP